MSIKLVELNTDIFNLHINAYPVHMIISRYLRNTFQVQEECIFLSSDKRYRNIKLSTTTCKKFIHNQIYKCKFQVNLPSLTALQTTPKVFLSLFW